MTTVCLVANTLYYPRGGGHRWVYLNWALGLRSSGARVIWLEELEPDTPAHEARKCLSALEDHLRPYGLADHIALCSREDGTVLDGVSDRCLALDDAAAEADLLLNLRYSLDARVVARFRRTALLERKSLQGTGYRAAFLYKGGPVSLPAADPYRLTRLAMGPDTDLRAELEGVGEGR